MAADISNLNRDRQWKNITENGQTCDVVDGLCRFSRLFRVLHAMNWSIHMTDELELKWQRLGFGNWLLMRKAEFRKFAVFFQSGRFKRDCSCIYPKIVLFFYFSPGSPPFVIDVLEVAA
jgi:histone acetyltransferase (RNA polymerase elongator complex component)